MRIRSSLGSLAATLPLLSAVHGFEVPISHTQDAKQVCSGMWGGANTYINRARRNAHDASQLNPFLSDILSAKF